MPIENFPTVSAIIAKTREIAAQSPDWVYEKEGKYAFCRYVHDVPGGGFFPGCLFGHALIDLGVPAEWLHTVDEDEDPNGAVGIHWLLRYYAPDFEDNRDGAYWCLAAQSAQDKGKTWAEAVAEADNFYPNAK